jgi:hypothetical protein
MVTEDRNLKPKPGNTLMLFSQVHDLLPELMPALSDGFHPLNLPPAVLESVIHSDPAFAHMLGWMAGCGLGVSDLTVIVKGGSVKIAPPGIWGVDGTPIILFGFKGGEARTAAVDGLTFVKGKGKLYSVSSEELGFPVQFRLQSLSDADDLPLLLGPATVGKWATAPVGKWTTEVPEFGGSEEWLRFRDIIPTDGSLVLTVSGFELRRVEKKDGTSFTVHLLFTDQGTFQATYRQYAKVEGYDSYRVLMGAEGPFRIKVTQDGLYSGHKVFTISQA